MKRTKVIGIISLALACIVLLAGVFSVLLRGDNGLFSSLLDSANSAQAAEQTAAANVKNGESAARKVDSAIASAQKAVEQTTVAADDMHSLIASLKAHEEDGSPIHDLYADVLEAQEQAGSISPANPALDESLQKASEKAQALLLSVLREQLADAQDSVDKAESGQADARRSLNTVLSGLGQDMLPEGEPFPFAIEETSDALDMMGTEAVFLREKALWLQRLAAEDQEHIAGALELAAANQQQLTTDPVDRFISVMASYSIAIWFTGILLLALGLILTFLPSQFMRLWKHNQVFSTFIALVVMLIVQTYSMKFTYGTLGEWGKAWFDNAFNVLRANTSVGIIALGMTMVIITGGIDLAVGSTLAGVGTVLMVLIDTSPRGILQGLGITGVPAYALGILGGILAGIIIGALVGLGITKGRVPPFIITLGVMNIVRSVAQFFTKSYTPKVPSGFTAISNTVVFGQRLLPIIYWLVLAALCYLMMERTRFGRYIYAVGSNERTTRLSGINVDRVKFMVYTLMGLLVSIAAITQVSRMGGMDVASSGSGYELDAIAAVVVGGTSMSGGRGSIIGTVLGVLIIGVMNNLLTLLGIDSFLTNAFKGAIVIAAVLMQRKQKEA